MKTLTLFAFAALLAVLCTAPSTAEARAKWHKGINAGPFWYGGGYGGYYGGWDSLYAGGPVNYGTGYYGTTSPCSGYGGYGSYSSPGYGYWGYGY